MDAKQPLLLIGTPEVKHENEVMIMYEEGRKSSKKSGDMSGKYRIALFRSPSMDPCLKYVPSSSPCWSHVQCQRVPRRSLLPTRGRLQRGEAGEPGLRPSRLVTVLTQQCYWLPYFARGGGDFRPGVFFLECLWDGLRPWQSFYRRNCI